MVVFSFSTGSVKASYGIGLAAIGFLWRNGLIWESGVYASGYRENHATATKRGLDWGLKYLDISNGAMTG